MAADDGERRRITPRRPSPLSDSHSKLSGSACRRLCLSGSGFRKAHPASQAGSPARPFFSAAAKAFIVGPPSSVRENQKYEQLFAAKLDSCYQSYVAK
jgi:hypothetical protein